MKIFVINSGSSSLKYQLIEASSEKVLARGVCERIGMENSFVKYWIFEREPVCLTIDLKDHESALKQVIQLLVHRECGVIEDISEIDAIGHRISHGGDEFSIATRINEKVLDGIKACIGLAPLHNPAQIAGIEACQMLIPEVRMVAVFDTAYHQTIPEYAYIYPLPYELYEKYKVRKYGFHGISHQLVAQRVALLIGKPIKQLKIITCHLGNGASICAVKNGESIDTSMGFTPIDGLAMGTRCGAIDPLILTYLMEKDNMSSTDISDLLNKQSGVLGISGISSDFRELTVAAEQGNKRAQLAIDVFIYRVKSFIGSYSAVMGGLDSIVFTAGIGENVSYVRSKSLENMEYLGIEIDLEKNKVQAQEAEISAVASKVKVFVVPTNEELAIARETVINISN